VNRELPFLYGESLEITLTVPLMSKHVFQLSRDGQLEELKRLLSDESVQAKINNLDEKKCSPLHYATR